MARRNNFEVRICGRNPTTRTPPPNIDPRKTNRYVNDEMTPAQTPAPSPEITDDESELVSGQTSPVAPSEAGGGGSGLRSGEYEDEETTPSRSEEEEEEETFGVRSMENRLSPQDLAVLERAAQIMRSQMGHFDAEIKANIAQRKDSSLSPILG
jgi:hypothetical protein